MKNACKRTPIDQKKEYLGFKYSALQMQEQIWIRFVNYWYDVGTMLRTISKKQAQLTVQGNIPLKLRDLVT